MRIKKNKERKQSKETVKTITKLYKNVVNDYLDTFSIMKNGTIKATNENYEKIRKFLENYQSMLLGLGFDLREIKPIDKISQGNIEKINENKVKMIKLFGLAHQLYLSACRVLRIQPHNHSYEFL
jgi:hypothetical protein